jgi:hypothetical protein
MGVDPEQYTEQQDGSKGQRIIGVRLHSRHTSQAKTRTGNTEIAIFTPD